MPKFHILGRVHPKTKGIPRRPDWHPSSDFTPDEIDKLRLVGKPLNVEHAGSEEGRVGIPSGRITHQMTGSDGDKYIIAEVDTKTKAGRYVKGILESGLDGYLSITHRCITSHDGRQRVKEAIDVSIAESSGFDPSCKIMLVVDEPMIERAYDHVRKRKGFKQNFIL